MGRTHLRTEHCNPKASGSESVPAAPRDNSAGLRLRRWCRSERSGGQFGRWVTPSRPAGLCFPCTIDAVPGPGMRSGSPVPAGFRQSLCGVAAVPLPVVDVLLSAGATTRKCVARIRTIGTYGPANRSRLTRPTQTRKHFDDRRWDISGRRRGCCCWGRLRGLRRRRGRRPGRRRIVCRCRRLVLAAVQPAGQPDE